MLAPDGIASGLAHVGLFIGDKNAPDEFGAVFQGAIDKWHASVTNKNGGIYGRSPYEDVERSCGVTLFADDVFEKSLLEKGTADECEHTVARRMGEVNSALETSGLRQNAGKLVILPNLRRTVENRKFSRSKQEYQIKASHRFLGIVYPAMLSMVLKLIRGYGLQIALGESSMECGGTRGCHTRSNGRSFAALFAEPPSRASLHFSFMTETTFDCRDAWRKSSALSCSARPPGKDQTT